MNSACTGYERSPESIGCKHCLKFKKEHTKAALKKKVASDIKPFVGKPYDPSACAAHHDAVVAAPWLAGMATAEADAAPSARLRVLCVLDGVEADYKVLDHFDAVASEASYVADWTDSDVRRAECLVEKTNAKRRRDIAEKKLSARLSSAQITGMDIDVSEEDGPIDDVHGEVKVGGKWVRVSDYDLVFLNNEWAACRCLAAGLPPSRVVLIGRTLPSNIAEQHRAPYAGALWEYGFSDEQAGWPKALAVLRSWSEGDLQREKSRLYRGTFDRVFGGNAKRALRVVEQVIAERPLAGVDQRTIPATLTALLRRIGDLVAARRRQLALPWGAEVVFPLAPSLDDAAVDEAILKFAQA